MYLIIKKVGFLVGLTLCVIVECCCQVVTSTRDGLWTDPMVWDSNFVPVVGNATETVVNHNVIIPAGSTFAVQNVIVNDSLTVESGSVIDLIADAFPEKKDLQVFGVLTLQDGATLNGTSVTYTSFESGARYIHLQGPLGYIPYATWDTNSTFEIAGFRTQGYINIAHSDSWKQNFGHVVYNCAQQSTAFVDLNGYLRNIAGNFTIQSTNNQALRLSTTQNPVISIGGDLIVEGPSKLWFSTTPTNAIVNVQNDFRYRSTSSGISYLTTKGRVTLNVRGDVEMNSPGKIHMASTSTDSTGTRETTLNVHQGFSILSGVIIAPPSPGKGIIHFAGSGTQYITTSATGSSFQGNIDYIIDAGSIINLGNSVLSNSTGSLLVRGTLQVGSSAPGGAIQLTNNGNIQVQGGRTYEAGATIEYNGVAEQWIGEGHPASPEVDVVCNNGLGVTLLKDIVVKNFSASGKVDTQTFSITAYGNVSKQEGVAFNPSHIKLLGGQEQQLSAPSSVIQHLTINKSANAVNINAPASISGSILIESINTTLRSNGYLTLLSVSDEPLGTASVGPIPQGSSITGDVTVHRHMDGEGRIYRFLSTPVGGSTVSSWQDDFPITGSFLNPSTGAGIRSTSPSLYYYDESIGGLQEGWLPYPTSGLASENPLLIGKGYAAFIRNATVATTWDVTGVLTQGTIELPVAFTSNNEPSNGWNLVGNPYACTIQWRESSADGWTMENISAVIATYDNKISGIYRYWDMDDNYAEILEGKIALGQSFWVRAIGPNPVLTIREGVKVLSGATFFRKEPEHIPSFAIRLSKDFLSDITYFKVRPQAKLGRDHWDGAKLDNDHFDISLLSPDRTLLAIQATNQMPCDTIVQLHLKDLTSGLYKIDLITKHEFSRYVYRVIDKFLKNETVLNPGQSYALQVTSDSASYAQDRISLHLIEREPDVNLEISGPAVVCSDHTVAISLNEAEEGIVYSIWNNDDQLPASVSADSVQRLEITFPSESMPPGEYNLTLKAHSACHTVALTNRYALQVDSSPAIHADSTTVCADQPATLEARSDRSDVIFSWFSDEYNSDTVAIGSTFKTPSLKKSQHYFAEATTPAGCKSERYAVSANVVQYSAAKIAIVGDTILVSNYENNNSWYFNSQNIEEGSEAIKLRGSGIYSLRIDTLGCVSWDTYNNILLTAKSFSRFYVYPNPVKDVLFGSANDKIDQVKIYAADGSLTVSYDNTMKNSNDFKLSVDSLKNGAYVVVIVTAKETRVVRFLKIL